MLLSRVAAVLVVVSACGPASGPDPKTCHFGDPTAPLQAVIVVPKGATYADLVDGGKVLLVRPPQFGRIGLVGVRATNFDGCNLTVNAAFRDPCTGRVLGLEERPVVMEPRGDGWAQPFQASEISNYANVGLCPAQDTSPNGLATTLEVRVTDATGRSVMLTAKATPSCGDDTGCPAECQANGLPPVDAGCVHLDGGVDAPVDAPIDAI
jgi:hypothetical protein